MLESEALKIAQKLTEELEKLNHTNFTKAQKMLGADLTPTAIFRGLLGDLAVFPPNQLQLMIPEIVQAYFHESVDDLQDSRQIFEFVKTITLDLVSTAVDTWLVLNKDEEYLKLPLPEQAEKLFRTFMKRVMTYKKQLADRSIAVHLREAARPTKGKIVLSS